jgi:hypothetical protein
MIQKASAVYVILFQNEVERSIASLKERNSELEEALTKLKTQDSNFDVDEAVVTTAVIYKQLSLFTQSSLMRIVIRLILFSTKAAQRLCRRSCNRGYYLLFGRRTTSWSHRTGCFLEACAVSLTKTVYVTSFDGEMPYTSWFSRLTNFLPLISPLLLI